MSLSALHVYGISHHSQEQWCERFVLLSEQASHLSGVINQTLPCLVFATCHRTEFICWGDGLDHILTHYSHLSSMSQGELMQSLHQYTGEQAWRYLLSVVSGLDSMVLGENEILGQFRKVYIQHQEILGSDFDWLMAALLSAAKKIRTQSDLGAHSLSLPAIALKLAEDCLGDVTDKKVVMVGSGQLAAQIVPVLNDRGVHQLVMMSQHLENARKFCDQGVHAMDMNQLESQVKQADILICMVSSSTPVIGKGLIERVMKVRDKKLFCLDLSMPRGVEPEVAEINQVTFKHLHDLESILKQSWQMRRTQAAHAQKQLDEHCQVVFKQYLVHTAGGVIDSFRSYQSELIDQLLKESTHEWSDLNPEKLADYHRRLKQLILHVPTKWLRVLAETEQKQALQLLMNEMTDELTHTS